MGSLEVTITDMMWSGVTMVTSGEALQNKQPIHIIPKLMTMWRMH
jgi:hypothetical protein